MLLPLFALSTALPQLPLLAVVKDWLEDAQNEGGKKIRKGSLENPLEGAENQSHVQSNYGLQQK